MRMEFKYKTVSSIINLLKLHKEKRVSSISKWIENSIFSDKKRFPLYGPYNWRTYIPISQERFSTKRQCGEAVY